MLRDLLFTGSAPIWKARVFGLVAAMLAYWNGAVGVQWHDIIPQGAVIFTIWMAIAIARSGGQIEAYEDMKTRNVAILESLDEADRALIQLNQALAFMDSPESDELRGGWKEKD